MAKLGEHFAYLVQEHRAAMAAPLSTKKALLVAMLIDAFVDRLFDAQAGEDDILAFRAQLAAGSAALAKVLDLASRRAAGAHLVIEPVAVATADYPKLGVEDFMISVYDGHTVQRVQLIGSDGRRDQAHALLARAIADLARFAGQLEARGVN